MRARLRQACSLGLVLLVACGPLRSSAPLRPESVTAEALVEHLDARRDGLTSLRARVRVRSGLAGVWTREALLVRRPGDVRVDVLSPFGLALAVGTQREMLWVYPPSQGVRYEGEASPLNLARFLGTPVTVADLVDILMGLPPAREATAPLLLGTTDDEYRVVIPIEDGEQTLWFSRETLELKRAEERRGDAGVTSVAFDDYREGFPHAVEVSAPSIGVTVKLAYDAVERNAMLEPALFDPPAAPRVLPLDAAATG